MNPSCDYSFKEKCSGWLYVIIFVTILFAFMAGCLTVCLFCNPLGAVILGIYAFWLYKTQDRARFLAPDDFKEICNEIWKRAQLWRQTKPQLFWFLWANFFASLALLGHLVSSPTLILSVFILIVIVAFHYNMGLETQFEPRYLRKHSITYADSDQEDEFLPEENQGNLDLLEHANEANTLSLPYECNEEDDDEKSDEIPSELLMPDTALNEINENSTDEDADLDELLPVSGETAKKSSSSSLSSSDSESIESAHITAPQKANADAEITEEIAFRRGHFKRNSSISTTSSSSDEENLSKGLKFPDHTEVDGATSARAHRSPIKEPPLVTVLKQPQAQAIIANSSGILPSIMSTLLGGQWGAGSGSVAKVPHPATALTSDEDSDFEMLYKEDLEK